MSGLQFAGISEVERRLEPTDQAEFSLNFKNDFEEIWVKNIQVRVLRISTPDGSGGTEFPYFSVQQPLFLPGPIGPQLTFVILAKITTERAFVGSYNLILKVEYEIAVDKMPTEPMELQPSIEVVAD